MNKRERFENFLSNKPVDRVPVGFWHHYMGFDRMNRGFFENDTFEENVAGHLKSKAVFDPDIVKIMTDSLMIMPIDCSKIEKTSDLYNIEPFALDSPYVKKSIELAQRVRDMYKEDVPVFMTGFTPLFPLRCALKPEPLNVMCRDNGKFFDYLNEDPAAVAAALDILGKRIMEFHKLLIEKCGIDGIYLSVNNRLSAIPDDIYLKYVAPLEKEVLDDANKYCTTLLHICGYAGQGNNLELYKDFDAKGINWSVVAENMTLGEGKKFFGNKPVFGGFAQKGILYTGTKEEIEAEVFRILDECGQVGTMLGADCTVPNDIDENRFEWVKQAAIKYAEK